MGALSLSLSFALSLSKINSIQWPRMRVKKEKEKLMKDPQEPDCGHDKLAGLSRATRTPDTLDVQTRETAPRPGVRSPGKPGWERDSLSPLQALLIQQKSP